MKYATPILLVLACILFAGTQFAKNPPAEHTDIQLHIEGLSSSWIYLQGVHENVKSKLDSVLPDSEGKASFSYNLSLDPGYYTIELPEEKSIPILLDRDQTFALKTKIDDLIGSMQLSGSEENTLMYNTLKYDIDLGERFQAEVQEIQNQGRELDQDLIDQLRQKYFSEKKAYIEGIFKEHPNTLFTKMERAKQDPEILNTILSDPSIDGATRQQLMLSRFWDNVDFSDERLLRTPVIFDKLWQYLNAYVPDQTELKLQAVDLLMEKAAGHPAYNRFISEWITEEYMPSYTGLMDPDALYVHMVDHYLTRERAVWADSTQLFAWQLRAKDRRVSLVGSKGENFEAKDPAGKSHALYDSDAPYIVLFFYHADCDHCIEETPKLVQQYRELKEQGLEVFAVSMGTPAEEWMEFIRKNKMDWINVTDEDNQDIYKKYFVRATPEIILLNPERTIIAKHLRAEDITPVIRMDQQRRSPTQDLSSTN